MRSIKSITRETYSMVCPLRALATMIPQFEYLELVIVADSGDEARRLAAAYSVAEYGDDTASIWLSQAPVRYETSTQYDVEFSKAHMCGVILRNRV